MSAERGWPGKGGPPFFPHTQRGLHRPEGGKEGPRCPLSPNGEGVPWKGGPQGKGDPLSAPHSPQSGVSSEGGTPFCTLQRGLSTAPQCPPLSRAPPNLPTERGSQVRGAPPLPSPPLDPLCPPPPGIPRGAPLFPPPHRGVSQTGRGGSPLGVSLMLSRALICVSLSNLIYLRRCWLRKA